jgi:hypothetical protein
MKNEQKIVELAKIDGWIEGFDSAKGGILLPYKFYKQTGERCLVLPQYLHSYDAILPLIQKQDYQTRQRIAEELWGIHGIDSDFSEAEAWATNMTTKPCQWALALLRAKGFRL